MFVSSRCRGKVDPKSQEMNTLGDAEGFWQTLEISFAEIKLQIQKLIHILKEQFMLITWNVKLLKSVDNCRRCKQMKKIKTTWCAEARNKKIRFFRNNSAKNLAKIKLNAPKCSSRRDT